MRVRPDATDDERERYQRGVEAWVLSADDADKTQIRAVVSAVYLRPRCMVVLMRFLTGRISRTSASVLTLGLAALWNGSALAGVNRWTVIGPPANIRAMAIDPHNTKILYGAGTETVARSDDGGITWTLTPVPGLLQPSAIRVAVSISSTVYALGLSDLYRSTTGGTSWVHRSIPSAAQFPNDLQVDATNDSTIVMACSNFCLFGCTGGGVFRSDNGGGSWHGIGLKDVDVSHVALDPTTSQIIYAVSASRLLRTSNGGGSWKEISPSSGGAIQDVAVDPVVPSTIYAAAESGIFRSADSGQSWEMIRASAYGAVIAAPAYGSRQLFASASGTALSLDRGQTWQELSTASSGLAFGSLWQVAVTPSVCYMVSDLRGLPGQILAYELQPPRRRAAGK
jgi:photosystem II stability/assembly factor-like uncharacterized protein